MLVRIKSVYDKNIWYSDAIGFEFEVVDLIPEDDVVYVPIPNTILIGGINYPPFMAIYRCDVELVKDGKKEDKE